MSDADIHFYFDPLCPPDGLRLTPERRVRVLSGDRSFVPNACPITLSWPPVPR
jgi:hypothetical protein